MANSKQASARRMKMADRARQQKELHFSEFHEDWLWHRTRNDGFTTLPRTMPVVMQAVDALSGGHPAGQVLLTLWCRAPDHALVTIESPGVFAAESGFTGLRAVDSWRRRMRKLVELGFIATKPGASGDFHYVLLANPHWAIEWWQHRFKDIPASIYNRFVERAMDVGAFGEIETVRGHIVRWEQETAASASSAVPQPPQLETAAPEKSQTEASTTNNKDQ